MNAVILIPARYQSSRFPGKPLFELKGASGIPKPLLQRTWEAAQRVPGVREVHVLTDDDRIREAAKGFGASVMMTPASCRNGTERCAAVAEDLRYDDTIVNLQGDALLTPANFVAALIEHMKSDDAQVATLAIRQRWSEVRALQAEETAGRAGGTSVVTDTYDRALYFSKKLIPYLPAGEPEGEFSPIKLHLGVYAYRPGDLVHYMATPVSELEELEGLEQLRFLAAGVPVDVVEVEAPPYSLRELNNPEDVAPIERALAEAGIE